MSNPPATAAPTTTIAGIAFAPPSHLVMRSQPAAGGGGGTPRSRAHSPSSFPMRPGQAMAQGSMGSQTQTQTSAPTGTGPDTTGVLRLRGAHEPGTTRQIHWAEDVVDNEGLGRKSSKVCCIYHAPKAVGESSSEDDSSSGSEESDSGVDDGAARMIGGGGGGGGSSKRRRRRGRRHDHGHEHGDDCGSEAGSGSKGKRRPSPNAYEKMPKSSVRREVRR